MTRSTLYLAILTALAAALMTSGRTAAQTESLTHLVSPGDSWHALALRFGTTVEALQLANPHPNPFREPVIGRTVTVPNPILPEQSGTLVVDDRSILQLSAESGVPAYELALRNGISHPAAIRGETPLLVPSGQTVRSYPAGFTDLELSHPLGRGGEGMGFRGTAAPSLIAGYSAIGTETGNLNLVPERSQGVGLLATGAFFWVGAPHLDIVTTTRSAKASCQGSTDSDCQFTRMWSQPLQFEGKEWSYNNITLTGAAAAIDADSILAERIRLFALWEAQSADYLPVGRFDEPITNYLYHSSFYGARRSYNGGPYSTYHEGLDYAAYRGTKVYAPADGVVILAETLYVRGGAVILDHGWGVYTGFYHMDTVDVEVGSVVRKGEQVGTVGTTGLSTGPHLHWDLLVNGIWVDPAAWRSSGLDCWLSESAGNGCD